MPCLLLTTNVDDRDQVTTVFTWIYFITIGAKKHHVNTSCNVPCLALCLMPWPLGPLHGCHGTHKGAGESRQGQAK